jgi:spermidine synthase
MRVVHVEASSSQVPARHAMVNAKAEMSLTKNVFEFLTSFLWAVKVKERKGTVTPRLQIHLSNGKYTLDSTDVNYSFGGLHLVFREAFSRFNIRETDLANALILGFGTGSVATILCDEYKKDVHLTGVERDPVVIDLAKEYFHIDRYKRLSLHIEDAGDFVANCEKKFDLVVVDTFVGADVPEEFREEKFLAGLGRLLSPRGISFFNVVVYNEKVRTGCASLFQKMNALVGPTEFCRIILKGTENWIFVCDKRR